MGGKVRCWSNFILQSNYHVVVLLETRINHADSFFWGGLSAKLHGGLILHSQCVKGAWDSGFVKTGNKDFLLSWKFLLRIFKLCGCVVLAAFSPWMDLFLWELCATILRPWGGQVGGSVARDAGKVGEARR